MKRYRIAGADRETGRDVLVELDASDEESATSQAYQAGIVISSVSQLPSQVARVNVFEGFLRHRGRPVGATVLVLGIVCLTAFFGVVSRNSLADAQSRSARNWEAARERDRSNRDQRRSRANQSRGFWERTLVPPDAGWKFLLEGEPAIGPVSCSAMSIEPRMRTLDGTQYVWRIRLNSSAVQRMWIRAVTLDQQLAVVHRSYGDSYEIPAGGGTTSGTYVVPAEFEGPPYRIAFECAPW